MSLCPHGYTAFWDCPECEEPMGTRPANDPSECRRCGHAAHAPRACDVVLNASGDGCRCGTDVGAIARHLGIANPEGPNENLRNALCILGALRTEVATLQNIVVGMTGATANHPAISECFEALSRRMWAAIQQLESEHPDLERARDSGAV